MIISEEAKYILEKMLKEEEKNTLSIAVLEETNQLLIDTLIMEDAPLINGIPVLMNPAAEDLLANVTLDAINDTDLVFRYNNVGGCGGCSGSCSGGCGGCSSDCHCDDSECNCDCDK